MTRTLPSILAAALMTAALHPADAATRTLRVPNRYDGAWTIVATTAIGPCSPNTRYQVEIKNGDASIPARDIDIDGGVSVGGAVRATIVQGANRAPITGNLDATGRGSGTWRTSGGLVACSGNWNAERAG